ncbi:MAG: serine hydrolase [Ruminococcaceae bacterium]|nr:serine hydrolase [Oscillospiraceae bacterium]
MENFELLERLAETAIYNNYPIYKIAMYKNGEVRQRIINPSAEILPIYSISKIFAAAFCGLVIDDGYLDYDTTVWDIFADEFDTIDPTWKEVTLQNTLSQTVGGGGIILDIDCQNVFDWGDDWLSVALNNPFVRSPGESFRESDSNFYLACRMAEKACGRRAQEVLEKRLFTPMRMQGWAWACCPRGHIVGGSGLYIKAIDVLKLGAMFMNFGEYNGIRILSEEFCDRATSAVVCRNANKDYGYAFSILKKKNNFKLECLGMNGQAIKINRKDNTVVVWSAYDDRGIIDMRFDEILES